MTTETDQMNEMSFRSDEQAQSQDRERQIQEAWDRLMDDYKSREASYWGPTASEFDLKLLRWALGLGS